MGDDASVSIGEQNQTRDREMLDEQWQQQDRNRGPGSDPFVRPQDARPAADACNAPRARPAHDADEYHPGEAKQPDREASEGLTGLGPAQPE